MQKSGILLCSPKSHNSIKILCLKCDLLTTCILTKLVAYGPNILLQLNFTFVTVCSRGFYIPIYIVSSICK